MTLMDINGQQWSHKWSRFLIKNSIRIKFKCLTINKKKHENEIFSKRTQSEIND